MEFSRLSSEVNNVISNLQNENRQLITQRRNLLHELKRACIEYPLFISLGIPITAHHQAVCRQLNDAQRHQTCRVTYNQFESAISEYASLAQLNATLIFLLEYYQKLKDCGGAGGYRLDGSASPRKPENSDSEL